LIHIKWHHYSAAEEFCGSVRGATRGAPGSIRQPHLAGGHIHLPADEFTVLDHEAKRANVAHELRAIKDVDLSVDLDVPAQRT
jgi:hypothetical protein